MRWSERQLAMLREMGIRVWAPASAGCDDDAGETATLLAEPAAAVAPAPVRSPATSSARAVERPASPAPAAGHRRAGAPSPASSLASAEWLVVGEPFDAAAADPAAAAEQALLLDNMLRAIRVARGGSAREGRACHLAVDLMATAADLDAAIAAVRPRIILALGRAAAHALLGIDEPLGRLRERVHERAGIPVVVTFALPYLLRHAEDKPRAWADLCRAVVAMT
jgi:DNA polymerase